MDLNATLTDLTAKAKQFHADIRHDFKQLQTQVDALDFNGRNRHGVGGGEDLLRKAFEESGEFKRLQEVGKGRCIIQVKDFGALETKTTITNAALGSGTSGVLMPERVGGIVPQAQRRLFLRDLLYRGGRTTTNATYFVQENAWTNAASPQGAEGSPKGESTLGLITVSRPVQTLAHWIPISRQVLGDMSELLGYVRKKLLYGLRYKEELQILAGDGTGYNLDGLVPQAATFDTSLRGSGWNRIDVLRRALQQVERTDEVPAGFFMLHPDDWATIELTKDSQGRYILGDPGAGGVPQIWGRPVVVSTAIAATTFLCGSSESAELIDREDATIEISTEHSDFFVRNLAAVLCECRTVLQVYRPGAFITGSLSSSPA